MKEYVYETKTIGNYKIDIVQDDMPGSPREWDNLGTMACFHRNYLLGDKHNFSKDEIREIYKNKNEYISLPLFLYDHSGITMNTKGYSCPWDSGQVGIIFVSKEQVRKEYNWKIVTEKRKKLIQKYLNGEVETYDQYLTGQVYGFQITNTNTGETDSCYGFYGEIQDCMDEAIETVQWNIKNDIKTHADKVKTWIKNRVPLEKRLPSFA